ncbi:MAG: hypothetical protein QOF70_7465, partial [Acetobacteraceae bacterium]|nr:hypothetical protein [Acetobacteraceae bacterium]
DGCLVFRKQASVGTECAELSEFAENERWRFARSDLGTVPHETGVERRL